jgi:hypothetical protein
MAEKKKERYYSFWTISKYIFLQYMYNNGLNHHKDAKKWVKAIEKLNAVKIESLVCDRTYRHNGKGEFENLL